MASSIASPTEAPSQIRAILAPAWRWLAIAGAALVLAVATFMLTRSGWFDVRQVQVSGADHLSRAEVVQLSGITKRDNAIWLDESAVEARLTVSAWVAGVDVRVDLPWTVTVTVTERSPIAVLERGSTRVLVAADGTLLGPGRDAGLPVIEAPPTWIGVVEPTPIQGIARALASLTSDVRATVSRVDVSSPRGLQLFLSDGVRIAYGSPRAFGQKGRTITDVLAWAAAAGQPIRSLDVSAPSSPAVVPAT